MTAIDIESVARSEIDAQIDAWVEATCALTGKVVEERKPWVTLVTEDSIRHFAYGTDDDNPLWSDPAYASKSRFGGITAPPAFVFANRYPILHGSPTKAPLASLIGGVEVEWHLPVRAGDRLSSEPRQKEFYEKKNKDGRRLNFVISEVKYFNQDQRRRGATFRGCRGGRHAADHRAGPFDHRRHGGVECGNRAVLQGGALGLP